MDAVITDLWNGRVSVNARVDPGMDMYATDSADPARDDEPRPEAGIWFDMERNIRDPHYRSDLETVRWVCRAALTTDQTEREG